MGQLVDGVWHDTWYQTVKGEFKREAAKLRHQIVPTEADVPEGAPEFVAEPNRYHLYVSYACPWAHRTLIIRQLKSLEKLIDVSVVSTDMLAYGWTFDKETGSTGDPLHDFRYAHELYTLNQSDYSGRVTVPILWDKKTNKIVNNESSDIIRIFNRAFNHLTGNTADFYPVSMRAAIDSVNERVYEAVNNGVYRAGFATTQAAYNRAVTTLFDELEKLEELLRTQSYLCGDVLTEADIRLFTTLIRFDVVYYSHFKCNLKQLRDYPCLTRFVKAIYQLEGVKQTVNFDHIKRHYYFSHKTVNPTQIVPLGPLMSEWND